MAKGISNKTITYHRFIPRIKEEFPELTEEQIEKIIRYGLFRLQFFITIPKRDILLKNNSKKFQLKIFKYLGTRAKAMFKKNGSSQDNTTEPQS